MEPLYVHLAIWLIPVSKPNIQIQIETPFGKWQFHGSFSKYCELCWEEDTAMLSSFTNAIRRVKYKDMQLP